MSNSNTNLQTPLISDASTSLTAPKKKVALWSLVGVLFGFSVLFGVVTLHKNWVQQYDSTDGVSEIDDNTIDTKFGHDTVTPDTLPINNYNVTTSKIAVTSAFNGTSTTTTIADHNIDTLQLPELPAASAASTITQTANLNQQLFRNYHNTAKKGRVLLHIADTHADPFYDYTQYWAAAPKISRSIDLYSNKVPAKSCGWDESSLILQHWNRTGGGPLCPCGQYGANPPFSVLHALRREIEEQSPEFILWGGDYASHYEPGTAKGDDCKTAKESAKATVTMLNAQFGKYTIDGMKPIEMLWGWGNNDVLPKRQPLTQEWLEEFGRHLLKEEWLKKDEMKTWNKGGFYKRDMGEGLCVIVLNSNSWTGAQINEDHHIAQLAWLKDEAFVNNNKKKEKDDKLNYDSTNYNCEKYLVNAHVPLGWLEGGQGHHQWENLKGAEVPEYSRKYREVLDNHHHLIIAELYGHINKADVRLMNGKKAPQNDPLPRDKRKEEKDHDDDDKSDDDEEDVSDSKVNDVIGDINEDIDGDNGIVSFTVAGISRRAGNDPQFQRIVLESAGTLDEYKHGITDIDVYSMKRNHCRFDFGYSFRELFKPHFNKGIDKKSLKAFVEDQSQIKKVESHLALTTMPYKKADLKDTEFIEKVRMGETGC